MGAGRQQHRRYQARKLSGVILAPVKEEPSLLGWPWLSGAMVGVEGFRIKTPYSGNAEARTSAASPVVFEPEKMSVFIGKELNEELGQRLDGSPDSRSCISVYSASCSLCWKSAENLTESRPSSPSGHASLIFSNSRRTTTQH